ncbi:MAG: CHAT domain-containing protein [Ignavibacteriaceae bacterium]
MSNKLINLPNSEDDMMRSATFDGKKFNELEHSEWEIKSILSLFNRKNIEKNSYAYFYSDATEEKFKASIKNYSIVHIATHSFINESQPQISGIVFAQPDTNQNSAEDGILYAGEIYNLDLNADLVVLSSCESGLGKLIKGEGMMALTRGFLYSGANNVLFSLWKVPDKPTSELMVEFYKNILSGNSYGNSLREAKLTLIKNSSTSRPRSWASFILVGGN